jgi:hypothetical protein
LVWVIAGLGGCGGNGMSGDAGPPDTGMPDSGMLAQRPAAVDTNGDRMPDGPPDLSCLGMRTRPMEGDRVSFTAHIYDFQSGESSTVSEAVDVDIFPDNVVTDDCSGSCIRGNTGTSGDVMASGPQGGWFAYRVHAGTGTAPTTPVLTIGYNRIVPAEGARINLPSVSSMTIGFIPSLFRRTRLPGTAIVSGSVTDCMGRGIMNAVLRVYRGDTELRTGPNPTDFFIGYFNDANVPDPRRTVTNLNGLYAAANVDFVPDMPIRIELWAVLEEGGELRRIACEEVRVFADAVTIISVGPTRSDYPAGSRCAR